MSPDAVRNNNMDACGRDPSALSFREKKTLFATISNSEQASPQIGRLNNQTVYSTPASFGPYFERHYQKWMSNSASERARLTPAKLFGDTSAVRRLFNNQKQSASRDSLEAATQTDISPAATRQASSPPHSPDLVALLWLPESVNAGAKPPNNASCSSSGHASQPSRPFRAVADLLGSFVEQTKLNGVPLDPRLTEALLIAQTGADGEDCAERTGRMRGCALSAIPPPTATPGLDGSGPQQRGGPNRHTGQPGGGTPADAPSAFESMQAARAAERANEASFAQLQREASQLHEELRKRALAQYDNNRLAAAALERSLNRLHRAAAAASSLADPGPTQALSPARGSVAPAAADEPLLLARASSALARQRDQLAQQCARLQRQCAGLLSYISMLSGNSTASLAQQRRPLRGPVGAASAAQPHAAAAAVGPLQHPEHKARQQQQHLVVEQVRVRLVVLPGEVQGVGVLAARPPGGALNNDDEEDQHGEGGVMAAEAGRKERVRLCLHVTRARGGRVPGLSVPLWPVYAQSPPPPPQRQSQSQSELRHLLESAVQTGEERRDGDRAASVHGDAAVGAVSPAAEVTGGLAIAATMSTAPAAAAKLRQVTDARCGDGLSAGLVHAHAMTALSGPPCDGQSAATTAGYTQGAVQLHQGGAVAVAAAAAAPLAVLPIREETGQDGVEQDEDHEGDDDGGEGLEGFGASNMKRCKSAPGASLHDSFLQSALDAAPLDAAAAAGFTDHRTPAEQQPFGYSSNMSYSAFDGRRRDGRASLDLVARVPTPPCSPRTSPCSPAISSDPAGSLVGSWSFGAGGAYHGEEYPGGYGSEEWELADPEWDELAAAAAANGPMALLSAVGFLREQLQLAHLEIVSLTTQLGNLSHQREGLRARACQNDAALQLLAINEGEALLEANRLRAQLASERAARARLSAQCEELQNRLLACIPDRHHFGLHANGYSGSLPREAFGSPTSKLGAGLAGPYFPTAAAALPRPHHGPHHGLPPHSGGGPHHFGHPQPGQQHLPLPSRHRSVPRYRPANAMSVRSGEGGGVSGGGSSVGGILADACKFAWLESRGVSRQGPAH